MKWVDRQAQLEEVVARSRAFPVVALDTEADSLHSYFDKVCLIQITAGGEDVLVDPLAKIDVKPLGELLADRSVRKVLHGADYDLRILQRDFGITISNLVDTMICAQLLGLEAVGLAALLKRYFDLDVDKSHQRANWAMRPLTQQMIHYATRDTHYLIELATLLETELRALGRWEWAIEEFERLEAIRFREPEVDPEAYRKIKGSNKLSRRGLGVLAELHQWRDKRARAADRPPFKIIGNEAMLTIATTHPVTMADLAATPGMPSTILRRYGSDLLAIVRKVLDAAEESLPQKVVSKPWLRDAELERSIERLKHARDKVAAELKIDAAVLAPRHALAAVAARRPENREQLGEIAALRRWQIELLGDEFVRISKPA